MRLIPFLIASILLWPPPALADTDRALIAYEQGDITTAVRELEKIAKQGDPVAQHHLGFIYFNGEGLGQNDKKAFYWFNQSARRGYAPSQDVLAYMYNHGRGVEPDKIRAYVWYSLAASNGIFLAQSIRKKLSEELSSIEMIQADLMVEDYLKTYRGKTENSD